MREKFILLLVKYAEKVRIYASKIFISENEEIVKGSFWRIEGHRTGYPPRVVYG